MKVTKVELFNSNLTVSNSQVATYTQTFRVELAGYTYINNYENKMYAEFFILNSDKLPRDYEQLNFENMPTGDYLKSTFRCTGREIKLAKFGDSGNDSSFDVWFVTCTWTANVGIVVGAVTEESRLISITRGFQPYDFVETKSYYSEELLGDAYTDLVQGLPTWVIQNSAGDPPSEGLTTVRNIAWFEMELEYKEEHFDPKWLVGIFNNTVNKYPITICDYDIKPAQGKTTLREANMIKAGDGQIYWIVKVLVEIKSETWITEWLDAGFNQIVDDKSTPIFKKDINSDLEGTETGDEKVDDSQKLDGNGVLLATGELAEYNRDIMIFPSDWAPLDFPTSLKGE